MSTALPKDLAAAMPPLGPPRRVDVTKAAVINRDPSLEVALTPVNLATSDVASDRSDVNLPKPVAVPASEVAAPTAATPFNYEDALFIPKVQVDFNIPIAGGEMTMSGLYHRVFCSSTLLVLGFDTRCRVSTQFRPPSLLDTTLNVTLHNNNGERKFATMSGGLGFSDKENSMDYTVLIIDTVTGNSKGQRDVVRDSRDIFPSGSSNDSMEPLDLEDLT